MLGVADFRDLLLNLPESSAYNAVTGPEGRRWTEWHELAYSILETVSVSATENTRLRKPLELTRPRYPERNIAGPTSDPAEVAAFFGMVYMPQNNQED